MDHREKVELTNKRSTADRDRTTDRARERRGGHLSFPGKCGPRMRTPPPPPPPKALDSCPAKSPSHSQCHRRGNQTAFSVSRRSANIGGASIKQQQLHRFCLSSCKCGRVGMACRQHGGIPKIKSTKCSGHPVQLYIAL